MERTGPGLARLLAPRSIAVVGGGMWCAAVIGQLKRAGFDGPIWPVHPSRKTVGGFSAVPDLDALPDVPDAVYVGVNRHATIEIVSALAVMGAGGAVCFASGFAEADAELGDGSSLQQELIDAAADMPILGPNCYGFINYLDNVMLWPDQHGGRQVDRGVALLMQSSNIAINLTMQARGLPVSYVLTVGNQAQLSMSDLGIALLADDRVTALGLYIEGVGDIRAFEALAETARSAGKPIVALKAGRSETARAATVSHTASLAGSDAGGRALLRRLGIAEVDNIPAFLETLRLLHVAGPLREASVATMSSSGGEASLVADAGMRHTIRFPPLNTPQAAALREALGPKVALANPLDYHTYVWGDTDAMARAYAAMTLGDQALTCVIADFPRADRCDPADWECVIEAAARARATTGHPIAILSSMAENLTEEVADRILEAGLLPLAGFDEMLAAVSAAAFVGRLDRPALPVLLPGSGGHDLIPEAEAKRLLSRHGLVVPRQARATTPQEAADSASEVGFPVVLKGEGQAHKSEAGLVVLDLPDGNSVRRAAQAMNSDAYLIEQMITQGVAELLIGVVRDPAHGFVLTLASGGVLTELMQDSVSLLLPVTADDIDHALAGLRMYPLVQGYRGKPGADQGAIAAAVLALQDFVETHAETLDEIEINPLICTPDGAVAADALIRMKKLEN